jgi:hypothetical protein
MEEVNDLILFRDWPRCRSYGRGGILRRVIILWVVLRVVVSVIWVVIIVSTVIVLGVGRIVIGFPVTVALRIPGLARNAGRARRGLRSRSSHLVGSLVGVNGSDKLRKARRDGSGHY